MAPLSEDVSANKRFDWARSIKVSIRHTLGIEKSKIGSEICTPSFRPDGPLAGTTGEDRLKSILSPVRGQSTTITTTPFYGLSNTPWAKARRIYVDTGFLAGSAAHDCVWIVSLVFAANVRAANLACVIDFKFEAHIYRCFVLVSWACFQSWRIRWWIWSTQLSILWAIKFT